MIVDDDIYEYLEHFGVKGMRWGTRKTRTTKVKEPAPLKRPKPPKTSYQVSVDSQKRAKRLALGLSAGAVGLVIAGSIMQRQGSTRTKSIKLPSKMSLDEFLPKGTGQVKTSTFLKEFAVDTKGTVTPKYRTVVSKKRILAS